MSSDPDTSFTNENQQEKAAIENKIPRSPAVAAYESYAAWRKKKFPPRNLEYKPEDYASHTAQNDNENVSKQSQLNPVFKKSSYFPNEDQNRPENNSNLNHPDSMLPRSSYFSMDSKNLISGTKSVENKRLFQSTENNRQNYNPRMFQGSDQDSPHTNNPVIRNSPLGNTIPRNTQNYVLSTRSDDSSPSSSNSGFSTKFSNPYSPASQYSSNSKPLQRENRQNFSQLRKSSNEYDSRLSPNSGALQPVRHSSSHRHSFPSCCQKNHNTQNPENGEMVKGLLKLIDNQNEQIKNLQSQLDRLLSIHQDVLKEKAKCKCSVENSRQTICTQAYNAALHTKSSAITADNYSNQGFPAIPETNQISDAQNRRNVHFDENPKKAIVERKVSIGVMTSFEFTVQNSPFNLENEIEEKQEEEVEEFYKESSPSVDIAKRKNLFSLMPSPLENIIEDSESHLSSQQPSSNCVSSCKSGHQQTQNGKSNTGRNYTNANNYNLNKDSSGDSNFIRNSSDNSSNACNYNTRTSSNAHNSPYTHNSPNTRNSPYPHNSPTHDSPRTQNYNKTAENRREFDRQGAEFSNAREISKQGIFAAKNAMRESKSCTPNKEGQKGRKEFQKFDIRNDRDIRNDENFQEESLILSGGELEVKDRVPPSPAPSIHVDMQEYSSEDGSILTKRTPKVGWTFYNNVLGQVNHILQNSPLQEEDPRNRKNPERQELDKNVIIDTVKAATMDQLKKLGISFVDNEMREANANKKVTFDTSYYSRLNPEMNMMQGASIMTETNTSMHMKALALKYLKEEQISDAMQQKQKRGALKNLMLSNVQGTTNMSFATMRYLQRYQLLPESMNGLIEDEGKENFQMPEISEIPDPVIQKPRINLQNRPAIAQTTKTSCPSKILDISTLKQQPKLL